MFGASLTVGLTVSDLNRAQLEALFDMVGYALMERQGGKSSLLDHSVSIDLGKGVIEIAVTTEAKTERKAQALADYYVHDVLRATGGVYTSDEPEPVWSEHAVPFSADVTSRELIAI